MCDLKVLRHESYQVEHSLVSLGSAVLGTAEPEIKSKVYLRHKKLVNVCHTNKPEPLADFEEKVLVKTGG